MRVLGLVFMAAGILVGVMWPRFELQLFGNQIAELEFTQLRTAEDPVARDLNLSAGDNPVRILFKASYLVGGKLPPLKIPVKVVLTDREGTLLSGGLSFSTSGIKTGPEQKPVRGSQSLNINIINPGLHTLYLSLAPNDNDGGVSVPDIDKITATIIGNAPAQSEDYKALAAVLALAGLYLLMRSRRKKRGNGNTPFRWGRGD